MRLPERLLYEPQHLKEEKVTEKALTRSIVVSVIGILFCMACLFGLTWAWFSDSIVTSSNKITAATFDLNITVTEQTEQGTGNAMTVDEEGYYTLDAEKTYTVSLAKLGTAKTGFCHLFVITQPAEPATVYYTDSIPQIDEATETETEQFVFTLSGVSQIKFTAMWGQCPEGREDRVVHCDGTLPLGAVSMTPPATKQNEATKAEETTAPVQTAAPSATEPQQTESTAGAETAKTPEATGTPETNATEPSETEGGEGETPSETPSGSETPTE